MVLYLFFYFIRPFLSFFQKTFHFIGYSYLLCLLENGDLKTFNLPSLKPNSNLTLSLNFREQEIR